MSDKARKGKPPAQPETTKPGWELHSCLVEVHWKQYPVGLRADKVKLAGSLFYSKRAPHERGGR